MRPGTRPRLTSGTAALLLVATAALVVGPTIAPATAGSPPVLAFTVSPSPAFGSVEVGSSLTRTFTLTNSGGGASAVIKVALAPGGAFTVPAGGDQCTGVSLGPKKSCSVTVRYTPAAMGASDSATLTASAKKPRQPATLALTGTSPLDPLAACKQALASAGYSEPADANYVLGTVGDDVLTSRLTTGNDILCGFEGNDSIGIVSFGLAPGDIFLGGTGADSVFELESGAVFDGGSGPDSVTYVDGGTFNGGDDDDVVTTAMLRNTSIFNGGQGNDAAGTVHGGLINGGAGDDSVFELGGAAGTSTFYGGTGDDRVHEVGSRLYETYFYGEDGCDGFDILVDVGLTVIDLGDQSTCAD